MTKQSFMYYHSSRSLFEMMSFGGSFFGKLGAHQTMLMDKIRCEAFRRAIHRTVKTGDIVADIGAGTGLLAFFAAQAGAEKVYAVEATPMASLLSRLIEQNGLQKKITVVHGNSLEIDLPEKVNVIVSETIGFWGIDEYIVKILSDAKMRYGLPGTTLIPNELTLFLAPIEAHDLHEDIEFWAQQPYGIDYTPASKFAYNNVYTRILVEVEQFLAEPISSSSLLLQDEKNSNIEINAKYNVSRDGTLHGLAGWFKAKLTPEVFLDTDPRSETLHWKQCFFPLARPVEVKKGDMILCNLVSITQDQIIFRWDIEIYQGSNSKAIARFSHSTEVFDAL